jgi:hypothetical protein
LKLIKIDFCHAALRGVFSCKTAALSVFLSDVFPYILPDSILDIPFDLVGQFADGFNLKILIVALEKFSVEGFFEDFDANDGNAFAVLSETGVLMLPEFHAPIFADKNEALARIDGCRKIILQQFENT